jgi:hypothetical protein
VKLGLGICLVAGLLYGDLVLYLGTSSDTCVNDTRWDCSDALATVTYFAFRLLLGLLGALLLVGLYRVARRLLRRF